MKISPCVDCGIQSSVSRILVAAEAPKLPAATAAETTAASATDLNLIAILFLSPSGLARTDGLPLFAQRRTAP